MIWTLTQVAIGGALGSVLRFVTMSMVGTPLATALINITGSLAMGALFVLLNPRFAPLIMTGVLGGFTTFSAFSLDALKLYTQGQSAQALLYIAGTVLLSLIAVALGAALARGAFT